MPEEAGEAQLVDNVDELDTPDADTRTEESHECLRDPCSAEMRHVSAEDLPHDTQRSDSEDRGNPREGRSDRGEDRSDGGEGRSDRGEDPSDGGEGSDR